MASKAAHTRVRQYPTSRFIELTIIQLVREYAALQKNPTPYIIAHPSEANILELALLLLLRASVSTDQS